MKNTRLCAATERAIKMVQRGATRYAAAKAQGIALSTIYRAMPELTRHNALPLVDATARTIVPFAQEHYDVKFTFEL